MTTLKTLAIAAATVTLSAASASALTLNKVDTHALERANVGAPSYNGYAGGFDMLYEGTDPAISFAAWCLDIGTYMQDGDSEYTPLAKSNPNVFRNGGSAVLLSTTQKDNIQSLFDVAYTGVKGQLDQKKYSGGFQLALWEIIYEKSGSPLTVTDGDFKDSFRRNGNTTAAHDYANTILGMLDNDIAGDAYSLVFFESEQNDDGGHQSQNLVAGFMGTTPTGINPIPVPAAGLLLLGALGGLGLAKRRRKAG